MKADGKIDIESLNFAIYDSCLADKIDDVKCRSSYKYISWPASTFNRNKLTMKTYNAYDTEKNYCEI